jgi:hypothetical protein
MAEIKCVPLASEAWLDFKVNPTNPLTPATQYPTFTPVTHTISVRHRLEGTAVNPVTTLGDPNDLTNTIVYETISGDVLNCKLKTPLKAFKHMVTSNVQGTLGKVYSDITYDLPDLLFEKDSATGGLDFEEKWQQNAGESGLQVVLLTLIPKLNGQRVRVSHVFVHFECHRKQDFHLENVDEITIGEVAPLGEVGPQDQKGLLRATYFASAIPPYTPP